MLRFLLNKAAAQRPVSWEGDRPLAFGRSRTAGAEQVEHGAADQVVAHCLGREALGPEADEDRVLRGDAGALLEGGLRAGPVVASSRPEPSARAGHRPAAQVGLEGRLGRGGTADGDLDVVDEDAEALRTPVADVARSRPRPACPA